MHTVVPFSSTPACRFHMIQPVELYQWKRSPVSTLEPRLLCRLAPFSVSSITPPWPWTIALGRPVVPLEYTTQSGWSKGSQVGAALSLLEASVSKSWVPRCALPKRAGSDWASR